MKTSSFVSGSSVILAGWLAATFLNEVPAQRYPKLDRKPATASVEEAKETSILATTQVKPATRPVSFSR
ncbi:hypothetical protein JIN84_09675 [Luteolibacter yonseiensis]|uniref:Uncharacterized protein n=1 Tax=Luteolibacter yonseiensis TaxID=1144680 RepID=A0A934V790_9BACT|nr:hypothetical protein [Luteolibacter yonseiensis]MBK1815887.1 hypothetical protein [Luteolibacter yonseiensis]